MFTTAILSFREFLEAFLIVSVFLGVSNRLNLKRGKEILLAAATGLSISLLLPTLVFVFGEHAKGILTEYNADLLEGYLLIFSGMFIAYVVFSLHKFMEPHRHALLKQVKEQLIQKEMFDIALFLTIVFFIAREGFEVSLLTATSSLFSVFSQNIIGLLLGFIAAGAVGAGTFFSILKIPIHRIFQFTEWIIVIFGAAMVKNGITILSEDYFNLHLEKVLPIPLPFIPSDTTALGHVAKNLLGLESQLSAVSLLIMGFYIAWMFFFFLRKKTA